EGAGNHAGPLWLQGPQATAWSPSADSRPTGPAGYSGQPQTHAPSSPPRWSQMGQPHLQAGSAPSNGESSSTTAMSWPPSGVTPRTPATQVRPVVSGWDAAGPGTRAV